MLSNIRQTATSLSSLLLALMLASCMGMGALTLSGCTDDANSQDTASAQADEDQDNCYGDDLPARKSS